MAAATTIMAIAAVASVAVGVGSAAVGFMQQRKAAKKQKAQTASLNDPAANPDVNLDPGALEAPDARDDTGAKIRLGQQGSDAERRSGKKRKGGTVSGGSQLGFNQSAGLGGF